MDKKDALIEAQERVLENRHLGGSIARWTEYMSLENKRTKRQLLLSIISTKHTI